MLKIGFIILTQIIGKDKDFFERTGNTLHNVALNFDLNMCLKTNQRFLLRNFLFLLRSPHGLLGKAP